MKIRTLIPAFATACLVGSLFTTASAAVIVTDDGESRLRTYGNGQDIGYSFTVGASDLDVTALGIWDDGATDVASGTDGATDGTPDGLDGDAVVSLFDVTTETLLATVTIPASSAGTFLDGEFRYVALGSAVTLTAGTEYAVSAFASATDLFHHFQLADTTNGVSTSGDVGNFHARFNQDTDASGFPEGFAALDEATAAGKLFVGPNIQYNVVPEPGSLALLGLGGLALIRRRR